MNLNDSQVKAVEHFEGPALVLAGPGSGKTRVLTNRIVNLIQNHKISKDNILCVTFTNKAAKEIKERISHSLLEGEPNISWIGTFHSICSRVLRKDGHLVGVAPNFVIYDSNDQQSLIKEVMKSLNLDIKKVNPYAVLSAISSAKNELVDEKEYGRMSHSFFYKNVAKVYPLYQQRLKENNALDFDDIIFHTTNLFQKYNLVLEKYQNIFQFILIDEYQDTNKAQYVLSKLLSAKTRNLFVVGDMSQAIYSFRGADYRNILQLEKDYKEIKTYNLSQNYRSTQKILKGAVNVIKNNPSHIHLDLWTDNEDGEDIDLFTGLNEHEESMYVCDSILRNVALGLKFSDFAILYRTNAQSRTIEEYLIRAGVPYKIFGGVGFYARKEIKDLISYLKVFYNPKDSISWERILNTPTRGVGDKTIEKIKESNFDLDLIDSKTKFPFSELIQESDLHSTLELLDKVLEKTNYINWINDGTDEALSRIENIKELRSVASQFILLSDFLENVALIENSNKARNEDVNAVTLMTVHSAKGLEFEHVYMIGMEEGLFPHSQSLMKPEEIEEERRLMYVAITRAKKKLTLSNSKARLYFGNIQMNMPSRFLLEIGKINEIKSSRI
jgi:DNA helicase-2/ATP-dependent DNA helicase PcrA